MEIEDARTGGVSSERVAVLVDVYARRVYPAVLEQHGGASVSSPLGVWLLLAACVSAADGDHRRALEEALGCSAGEASELLAALMAADVPRAAVLDAAHEVAAFAR